MKTYLQSVTVRLIATALFFLLLMVLGRSVAGMAILGVVVVASAVALLFLLAVSILVATGDQVDKVYKRRASTRRSRIDDLESEFVEVLSNIRGAKARAEDIEPHIRSANGILDSLRKLGYYGVEYAEIDLERVISE